MEGKKVGARESILRASKDGQHHLQGMPAVQRHAAMPMQALETRMQDQAEIFKSEMKTTTINHV